MLIAVKTVRWQCSGCDRLCAMLLDGLIEPKEIVRCEKMNWRVVVLKPE